MVDFWSRVYGAQELELSESQRMMAVNSKYSIVSRLLLNVEKLGAYRKQWSFGRHSVNCPFSWATGVGITFAWQQEGKTDRINVWNFNALKYEAPGLFVLEVSIFAAVGLAYCACLFVGSKENPKCKSFWEQLCRFDNFFLTLTPSCRLRLMKRNCMQEIGGILDEELKEVVKSNVVCGG